MARSSRTATFPTLTPETQERFPGMQRDKPNYCTNKNSLNDLNRYPLRLKNPFNVIDTGASSS
jgi:hypothetical protein